jgi:hypothetical protein
MIRTSHNFATTMFSRILVETFENLVDAASQ